MHVSGGGKLKQWQRLQKEYCRELHHKLRTLGAYRDGTLWCEENEKEWTLVPLQH